MNKKIKTDRILQSKIALIVGGASGIGAGMCLVVRILIQAWVSSFG